MAGSSTTTLCFGRPLFLGYKAGISSVEVSFFLLAGSSTMTPCFDRPLFLGF
jgi:hypothetical protein